MINIIYVFCFKLDTDNDTVEKRLLFLKFFFTSLFFSLFVEIPGQNYNPCEIISALPYQ